MSKIYLFDLFDTILNDLSCDFDAGLRLFWERHFADRCSFGEMSAYGLEMYEYLHQVQRTGAEFCFATDEVPMYCKKFGGEPFALSEEEEWQIIYAVGKEEFRDDTKRLLDRLEADGTKMYILSNSIFRATALKRVIGHYGAGRYFTEVWSSADFGLRKPRPEFFNMAVEAILKDNPGATKADIIYTGNSYAHDMKGALGAGLSAVWLNAMGEENIDNLPIRIISKMSEL